MQATEVVQAVTRWQFQPEGDATTAHLAYGAQTAVVGDSRGNVYALSEQGNLEWWQNLKRPILGARVTSDGKAVFALTAHELIRFNWKGRMLWRKTLPAPGTCLDVRSVSQSAVVACGDLIRVFGATGAEVGGTRLLHRVKSLRVAGATGHFVACSERGRMTYVSREGEPVWQVAINAWCAQVDQDGEGHVVILPAGADGIYSFDSAGAPRGLYDLGCAVRAAAVDDNGRRIVAAGFDGLVRVLDASDGRTMWHGRSGGEVLAADMDPSGDRALLITKAGIDLLDFVAETEERGEFLEVTEQPDRTAGEPEPEWRLNLRSGDPSPEPVNAELAVSAHGRNIVVLEPRRREVLAFDGDGKLAWRHGTPLGDAGEGALRLRAAHHGNLLAIGGIGGLLIATFDQGVVASPGVSVRTLSIADAGTTVLAGDMDGRLHLYDANGEENWTAPTPGFVQAELSPRGDAFAIADATGIVRYYHRAQSTGWQLDLTPGPTTHMGVSEIHIATLDDGVAYCIYDGRVGVMDPTGAKRWEQTLSQRPLRIVRVGQALAVTDVGDRTHLFTLEGKPLRVLPTRHGVAVLADGGVEGLLEFHYNGKEINCFDVDRGIPLWKKLMPSRVNGLVRSGCGEVLVFVCGTHLVKMRTRGQSESREERQAPAHAEACFLEL